MACLENSKEDVTDGNLLGEKTLKLVAGAFYIPKETNNSNTEGDDSHFICLEKQTIGVADGVGGWRSEGIDPGEFARNLMTNTVKALVKQPKGNVDLRKVLDEAFYDTKDKGASTACIITLGDNCVNVINVGDSGFMLIRKETEELYKSPIQQHSSEFNCPYQLGKSSRCDAPESAQMFGVEVKSGDVLIAGTDGLFDNMFLEQIRDVAKVGIEEGKDPTQVAWSIAEHAYYNSTDRAAYTPFMIASHEAGREYFGGKIDDITVIVAYITDD